MYNDNSKIKEKSHGEFLVYIFDRRQITTRLQLNVLSLIVYRLFRESLRMSSRIYRNPGVSTLRLCCFYQQHHGTKEVVPTSRPRENSTSQIDASRCRLDIGNIEDTDALVSRDISRSTSIFNHVTRSLNVLSRDKRKCDFSPSFSFSRAPSSLRDGIFLIPTRRETLLCGDEYTVNACTRNLEPWSTDNAEIRAVLSVAFSCQSKRAESR